MSPQEQIRVLVEKSAKEADRAMVLMRKNRKLTVIAAVGAAVLFTAAATSCIVKRKTLSECEARQELEKGVPDLAQGL